MKKSSVTLLVAIIIAMSFTLSCSSNDSNEELQQPSSSSVEETPSSSGVEQSSSSSIQQSSSSVATPSSSSVQQSSSSVAAPSSSSVQQSSSSVATLSSSSIQQSSSSVATPSSSSEDLCAGFVEGTEIEHNGKQKKQFCDKRDGKKYVYVTIGTRDWMAENLNYNANNSRCYGDNTGGDSQNNCDKYGRLYLFNTVLNQACCPEGWNSPNNETWAELVDAVGSSSGTKLKAENGWTSGNGTDDFGFSALPGGNSNTSGGFSNAGTSGWWWTSTFSDLDNASYWRMNSGTSASRQIGGRNTYGSVRCTRLAQENPL